jgi:hypothetical protein
MEVPSRDAAGQSARAEYRRRVAGVWWPWWSTAALAVGFLLGALAVRLAPAVALYVPLILGVLLVPWAVVAARRSRAVAGSWKAGAKGEVWTRRLLRALEQEGYIILDDLAIPDSRANLDHLVIGPTGVYLVDAKNYRGRIACGDDGVWRHGQHRLESRLQATRFEAGRARELLADVLQAAGVDLEALWCVHGVDVLPAARLPIGDVLLVAADQLVDELTARPARLRFEHGDAIAHAARLRLAATASPAGPATAPVGTGHDHGTDHTGSWPR